MLTINFIIKETLEKKKKSLKVLLNWTEIKYINTDCHKESNYLVATKL